MRLEPAAIRVLLALAVLSVVLEQRVFEDPQAHEAALVRQEAMEPREPPEYEVLLVLAV